MQDVCESLADHIKPDTLIISVAAGTTCSNIDQWLGGARAVVRCMPNTPALLQEGASGLYANHNASQANTSDAEQVLAAVGEVCWVQDEALMDSVTAVSGSGPAYFFLFIESMIAAGVEQGLPHKVAETLAIQTAVGAAKLAKESDVDVAELRRRVTSPKGTTEQAILSFEENDLRGTVKKAMDACKLRGQDLAKA